MSSTTTSSSNNNNAVGTIQIKDAQNNLTSIPIYKQNTKLYYKQGGSNVSLVPVQIMKVHLDDIEPYYTIRLLNDDSGNGSSSGRGGGEGRREGCREKQTDNDHLTLNGPIWNDEFGSSDYEEAEEERLQSRRVHWKNEDKSQITSTDIEQDDDKMSSSSKSSSKTLHTWQLEQIAKHVNGQKDTTEVEEKKKVLETWQLDQISKHMKQKQSTTSSTNNDNKRKEMGDTSEEEGEECSIITEECSIDTNDSSNDDKKTEGIEYQQQQVVAMEESWFCC